MNKVLINGNREVNVIRKRVITITTQTGETKKVKLKDYTKPPAPTADEIALKELKSIFPSKKKDERESVTKEFNDHDEYSFAMEMQKQIDQFQTKQRTRKRGRRHSSDWSN